MSLKYSAKSEERFVNTKNKVSDQILAPFLEAKVEDLPPLQQFIVPLLCPPRFCPITPRSLGRLGLAAMRLQLTVQRHGLPPTQILWTVGAAAKPPNVALATTITICQFLEQVNEIIPLEADEWGLEDYAVEVRGFECLHFSELSQVLREDDEVWYRKPPLPLLPIDNTVKD